MLARPVQTDGHTSGRHQGSVWQDPAWREASATGRNRIGAKRGPRWRQSWTQRPPSVVRLVGSQHRVPDNAGPGQLKRLSFPSVALAAVLDQLAGPETPGAGRRSPASVDRPPAAGRRRPGTTGWPLGMGNQLHQLTTTNRRDRPRAWGPAPGHWGAVPGVREWLSGRYALTRVLGWPGDRRCSARRPGR